MIWYTRNVTMRVLQLRMCHKSQYTLPSLNNVTKLPRDYKFINMMGNGYLCYLSLRLAKSVGVEIK